MIYTGHLVAHKLNSRLSFVRQSDIEEMLKRNLYKKRQPKDTLSITDFYITNEIKEKFGVKDSWIFHIAKEHNIPRIFHRGKTYWSKKHFDDYFAKKAPDPEIKEWYSTQDMQEKFGMTLTAIYFLYQRMPFLKRRSASWYTTPRNMRTLPKVS